MVPESYYLVLSAVLFAIGVMGVVVRRNPLVIFMSIELALNAANLALVASAPHGSADDRPWSVRDGVAASWPSAGAHRGDLPRAPPSVRLRLA